MKKTFCILVMVAVIGVQAQNMPSAHPPTTNTPAGKGEKDDKGDVAKNDAATIPDATHKPVFTTNTVTIAGQRVKYVAETGMLPILKTDGTTRASVFYVAYTRLGETNTAARPVTFCFNGGPGSSSVWLHLGALGPRRVKMNPDGTLPPPPFGLVDNEYSILDASDLVFIDPVATGFSRPAKDEKTDAFFGDEPIWIPSANSSGSGRRGMSAGSRRNISAAKVTASFARRGWPTICAARYGMYLNGLILVSGVLDFAHHLGQCRQRPALSAVSAGLHGGGAFPQKIAAGFAKRSAEGARRVARICRRANTPRRCRRAIRFPPTEHKKIAAELARLTGLKPQVIEDNNLRIDEGVFRKQLLHDEGLILGAYDARITGRDDDPASPYPDFDPSDAAALGPFSAAMNSYVRSELKFEDDLPYEIIAGVQPWNYGVRNNYASAGDKLAVGDEPESLHARARARRAVRSGLPD